jgi:hypothetical protein
MSIRPPWDSEDFVTPKATLSCSLKAQYMNRSVLFTRLILSGGHAIFHLVMVYSAYPSVAAMPWRCGHIVQNCLTPPSQSRCLRGTLMSSKSLYGEEVVAVSIVPVICRHSLNALQIGATSSSLPGRKTRRYGFGRLIRMSCRSIPSYFQKLGCITHVSLLKSAGQPTDGDPPPRAQGYGDNSFSFRIPPEASHARPALSAPVGQRGILAEVRAPYVGSRLPNPVLLPLRGARDTAQVPESEPEQTPTVTGISVPPRQGGTMSRVNRSVARMDALTWLSSFRSGERAREGSSGTGSGAESGNASRIGSRSRPSSRDANSAHISAVLRRRSDSRGHWDDESEGRSLQDE